MFLADFHIHSSCSDDACNTMAEMAEAERNMGINCICFTDHCDLEDCKTGEFDPCYFDNWGSMQTQYAEAAEANPAMDIRLGVELGAVNHRPEEAAAVAATKGLDFIIASIHQNRGCEDFYYLDYKSEEHCNQLINDYLLEYLEIADLDVFDVLGHIGYARRYMVRAGFKGAITLRRHGDILEELFKKLIQNGKGVELNCSGYRNPKLGEAFPVPPVLKLYKDLGGEIVTVGSDAHRTRDAGTYIRKGLHFLRRMGYNYVTVFKDRKPEFVKIKD